MTHNTAERAPILLELPCSSIATTLGLPTFPLPFGARYQACVEVSGMAGRERVLHR